MKKKKPRYNMLQNSIFMIREGWKEAKSVPFIVLLLICFHTISNLLNLYVVPAVLRKVESAAEITELLITIGAFSLAMIFTGGILSYLSSNTIFGRVQVRMTLFQKVGKKLCTTSYPNMENPAFLKEMEAAYHPLNSNSAAGEAIWDTLTNLTYNTICFIIYLMILTDVNPLLVLITIATSAAGYFVNRHFGSWANRHRDELAEYSQKMHYINKRATERRLAKDIRIFQLGPWLEELYEHVFSLYMDFCKREHKIYVWGDLIGALLVLFRNGFAYAYLIHLTLAQNLEASAFLLYFSAITGFTSWVTGILSDVTTLHRQSLDISVTREFLERKEEFLFEDGKPLVPDTGKEYEITLKDVSFRYPGAEKDTLSHINLTIKPGEKLAVVGLNGAGKTTLIKLICGFYDPTEGAVLLNGEDIRQYNRRDYYRHFCAVFQNYSILAGTIAENVAQSHTSTGMIDEEKVRRCLKEADLTAKIDSLPKGVNTNLNRDVYEDAIELSGGEQQRLLLARALYKDSPIMLLDEPTAALDPIAESRIYKQYQHFSKGRTSVYISHRLASTRFCERILLLENGGIAEEGTHESLLAKGGRYAWLFEVQSKYYKEEFYE